MYGYMYYTCIIWYVLYDMYDMICMIRYVVLYDMYGIAYNEYYWNIWISIELLLNYYWIIWIQWVLRQRSVGIVYHVYEYVLYCNIVLQYNTVSYHSHIH